MVRRLTYLLLNYSTLSLARFSRTVPLDIEHAEALSRTHRFRKSVCDPQDDQKEGEKEEGTAAFLLPFSSPFLFLSQVRCAFTARDLAKRILIESAHVLHLARWLARFDH